MRPIDVQEERRLVARAKSGDMDAYEELVRAFQRPIYYLCLRMTSAHQTADDLAQETFIKAYQALDRFEDGRDVYPWLRRIAVNAALNLLKQAKREEPLAERDGALENSPHDELQRHEVEESLRAALGALPPDQRAILVLRVFEDQSYRDIARSLRVSIGTVMSRLNRARRKVRAALAPGLGRRGA